MNGIGVVQECSWIAFSLKKNRIRILHGVLAWDSGAKKQWIDEKVTLFPQTKG